MSRSDLTTGITIQAHVKCALTVAWHPTNQEILCSGGIDRHIKVWNIHRQSSSQEPLRDIQTLGSVGLVKWRHKQVPHTYELFSKFNQDPEIQLWHINNPSLPHYTFKGHPQSTEDFVFDSKEDILYSVSKEGGLVAQHISFGYRPYTQLVSLPLSFDRQDNLFTASYSLPSNPQGFLQKARDLEHRDMGSLHNTSPRYQGYSNLRKLNEIQILIPKHPHRESRIKYIEYYAVGYRYYGDNIYNLCLHNAGVCRHCELPNLEIASTWEVLAQMDILYGGCKDILGMGKSSDDDPPTSGFPLQKFKPDVKVTGVWGGRKIRNRSPRKDLQFNPTTQLPKSARYMTFDQDSNILRDTPRTDHSKYFMDTSRGQCWEPGPSIHFKEECKGGFTIGRPVVASKSENVPSKSEDKGIKGIFNQEPKRFASNKRTSNTFTSHRKGIEVESQNKEKPHYGTIYIYI